MSRTVTHRYRDPVDEIWLACARAIGLRVTRTDDAFVQTGGDGIVAICSDEHLDADDCLAQMIFHELCHSLVEGEESFRRKDWGLDNASERDVIREHACLRVQATIADRYGLRAVLAPTTDFREFYDALGRDALKPRDAPSTVLAVKAIRRVGHPPWGPHLLTAMSKTAAIARLAAPAASAASLWGEHAPAPPDHPTGLAPTRRVDATCGACVWSYKGGSGRPVLRCRQADNQRIEPYWPACERYEASVDCLSCGACCRAAYHSVTISRRDQVNKKHPDMVVDRGHYVELKRAGDRCAALEGGKESSQLGQSPTPYSCRIYPDRPSPCREFEAGGEHCVTARRRVGLSL